MKKLLLLIMMLFIISSVSASISYVHSYSNPAVMYQYIYVNTEAGTLDFKTIFEYFEDNPIAERNISYPRFYGSGNSTHPYELNEGNADEWNTTSGSVTNTTSRVYYGSSALNVSGTSGSFIVKWNLEDQIFAKTGYHWFKFLAASEIRFMVYSDVDVNISEITTKQAYSATNLNNYIQRYVKYREDVWQIPANTWTEVVVDMSKDMTQYSARYYAHSWTQLYIEFDSTADVVIDGARWVLPDPTPRIKRINYYTNPIGLFVYNTDFDDNGFIYEATSLDGRFTNGLVKFQSGDVTLGSQKYGGVFITNARTTTDNGNNWMFVAGSNDNFDIDGLTYAGSKGFKTGGFGLQTSSSTAIFLMDDIKMYGITDVIYTAVSGADFNITNFLIGESRYSLWGSGHQYINFNGYTYYDAYFWMDKGSMTGLTPKTDSARISYHRSYQRPSNSLDSGSMINMDKSFLTSSQYMQLVLYEKAGNTNVTIDMTLLNTLSMTFIDSTGATIENVIVSITGNGSVISSGLSDSNGNYEDNIKEVYFSLGENLSNGVDTIVGSYYPITGNYVPTTGARSSIINYNPLTISISKSRYQDASYVYDLTSKESWTIELLDNSFEMIVWSNNGVIKNMW